MDQTGLQRHHLNIEITESVLIESIQTAVVILDQLKARNAHITIDDFGTGYFSLSYLHQLPVDAFKIDRSFVNNMETNSRNSDIVETIITLSNRLGLHTVAEGIETEQQLQHLRSLGCELGQGYLFARPIPSEAIEAFFPTPSIGGLD
ncbi:MAG TPA: EAL domain-containing protein [Trichocoleus sp.]